MFEDLSGAALAAALEAVDPAGLDAAGALDYAVAMRRVESWATAGEAAGLARLHDVYPDTGTLIDRGRAVTQELSAALGCSTRSAGKRLGLGMALADLPATSTAMRAGLIDVPRAWVMIEHTLAITDPSVRQSVEEQVLAAHAAAPGGLTMRQWHALAGRLVAQLDAAAAEQRRRTTRPDREVGFSPPSCPGGDATLWLRGPAEQLAACDAAIDALARAWQRERQRDGGCAETLAQLRFDAAVWLMTHAAADRVPAGVVIANVTVPLSTLLGCDDAPGEMDRVGPIPASLARELAAQASVWRRLLTDPEDGHLVTQQLKTYRPSPAMRAFVLARAGWVCASRGCGARRGLQHDHLLPHPDGPTSADNLGPFCGPDHNIKTHGKWRHTIDPASGTITQTSPLGRDYTTAPLPPPGPTGTDAFHDPHDPPWPTDPPWPDDPPCAEDRAERDELAALHRLVAAETDYALIAAITAADLAWLNSHHAAGDILTGPDLT